MSFDPDRYQRDVLEPARVAGGQPPGDLLVRYALTTELPRDRLAFERHLAEVVNFWRTLRQRRAYAKLAEGLLAAHAALLRDGALEPAELQARTERMRKQARDQLARRLPSLAVAASCVTPATTARLAASVGGMIDEAAVRRALSEHGVRVVDPVELPGSPPASHREVRRGLDMLGLHLSPEVVVGDLAGTGFHVLNGFRLGSKGAGQRLTPEGIALARTRLDTAAQDERKTAAATVLTVLATEAGKPNGLDALLLSEVVELLRPSAESGLPQRALADEAMALGLDAEEAGLLALSMLQANQDRNSGAASEVEEALAEGRLREAQGRATALPKNEANRALLERIEKAVGTVAELSVSAERVRAQGRTEYAAELLAEALRMVSDDEDLRHRYRSLPPPEPSSMYANVADGRVIITWSPSPARVGAVSYRVVRSSGRTALGPGHGRIVGETAGLELTDATPPVGEPLYYTVFALRGEAVSNGLGNGPVIILPEVEDLRLIADAGSVTGSWRLHPRATRAAVTRASAGPPGSKPAYPPVRSVTPVGFSDTDVRSGVTYQYRVAAVYLAPDSSEHLSPGLVRSATPESLTAVRDLSVSLLAELGALKLRAGWTSPSGGAVSLRLSDTVPPWATGADVPMAQVGAFGQPLPGRPERAANGRVRLTVSIAQVHGQRFVTPITVGIARAVVGTPVEVAVSEPVRGLSQQRLGETVRLAWAWPTGSIAARVRWWPSGLPDQPLGELLCQRRSYEVDGGFSLEVGREAVTIAVQALVGAAVTDLVSAAAEVEVPALGASVRWSIRRGERLLGRRRRRLVLMADTSCTLPPLVIVQRPGSVLPTSPTQGQVIKQVAPQRLNPAMPLEVEFELAPVRGTARLGCFARAEEAATGVTLIPPPPRQLEIT
jgi:hypothetical protein